MALFGMDKEDIKNAALGAVKKAVGDKLDIKVLGSGGNCQSMLDNVNSALKNKGMNIEAEYITDSAKIAAYGEVSLPALVINGKVVSVGQVLQSAEIEKLLEKVGIK